MQYDVIRLTDISTQGRTPWRIALTVIAVFAFGSTPAPTKDASAQDVPPASRAGEVRASGDYVGDLTSLLREAVQPDGLVRYRVLARHAARFRGILKAVEDYRGPLDTDEEKIAFWINAYNVHMLQNILDNPAVRDIIADDMVTAFFNTPVRVAGHALTLDEIEHVVLRRDRPGHPLADLAVKRRDPRIHVGLNCAAVSCPALQASAFAASTVDAQLDDAMRTFVNSDRHFRIEGDSVVVSSLLDWFSDDWDLVAPAGDYLSRFMEPSRPDYSELAGFLSGRDAAAVRRDPRTQYEYVWTVNRAR